jgi:hypothetical protein
MTAKPIGVWISLALAILGLSGWLGWTAGSALGTVRYRAYPLPEAHLPLPLRRHIKAELDNVNTAQMLELLADMHAFGKQIGEPTARRGV